MGKPIRAKIRPEPVREPLPPPPKFYAPPRASQASRRGASAELRIPITVMIPPVVPPTVMPITAMVVPIPPAPRFSFGRDDRASDQKSDERSDDDPHGNLNLHRQQVLLSTVAQINKG
jgi:hypothetical protein